MNTFASRDDYLRDLLDHIKHEAPLSRCGQRIRALCAEGQRVLSQPQLGNVVEGEIVAVEVDAIEEERTDVNVRVILPLDKMPRT